MDEKEIVLESETKKDEKIPENDHEANHVINHAEEEEEEDDREVDRRRQRQVDSEEDSDEERVEDHEEVSHGNQEGIVVDDQLDKQTKNEQGMNEEEKVEKKEEEEEKKEEEEEKKEEEEDKKDEEEGEEKKDDEDWSSDNGCQEPRESPEGKEEEKEDEEEQIDEIPKESPMYVPKGPYYLHDSRSEQDNEENDEDGQTRQPVTLSRSEEAQKWEHDKYDEQQQRPREDWEKQRDKNYYEQLEQRRQSGEDTRRGGRGQRGTRLGQYLPRRDYEGRQRYRDQRESSGRREGRRVEQWEGSDQRRYRGQQRNEGTNRKYDEWDFKEDKRQDDRGRRKPREDNKERKNESSSQVVPSTEDWDDSEQKGGDPPSPVRSRPVGNSRGESLFLNRNSPTSGIFTSKVFSLNSQTNQLIVKDVDPKVGSKPVQRRLIGRGRGRVAVKNTPLRPGRVNDTSNSLVTDTVRNPPRPGTEEKTSNPLVSDTVRNPGDIKVIKPFSERSEELRNDTNHLDIEEPKTETSVDEPRLSEDIDTETNTKVPTDEDKTSIQPTKPKRYSSRRQKTGGNIEPNYNGVTEPGINNPEMMQQPSILPGPYHWPYGPSPMADPMQQHQMMMAMMQNPAVMQQQIIFYQQQLRMLHDVYQQGLHVPIPGSHPIPFPGTHPTIHEQFTNSSQPVIPTEGEESSGQLKFVPPMGGPDSQKVPRDESTHKPSRAIPIIPPGEQHNEQ